MSDIILDFIFSMVRCSIKRILKNLCFLIIFLIVIKNLSLFSKENTRNKLKSNEKKSLKILIHSKSSSSKSLQRLILFLNELRLSFIQYKKFSKNFLNYFPSIIILDYIPKNNFYNLIQQYQISLLIFLNKQCQNCIQINYTQMLFKNLTYSTINFNNQNEFKPIFHTIKTPFQIQQSNPLIQLLRFEKFLPYFSTFNFHHYCIGLTLNQTNILNTIIYVENKQTLEKIHLLIISSEKEIYLSECLTSHWFIWPLIMDIFRYLTMNSYDYYGLNRSIQIDIDDIFLGEKTNNQLKSNDIHGLIYSQKFIRNFIPNFRYRLGFSGFYYNEKNDGDHLLIKEKDNFLWFHHTWKHEKLTNINNKISLINSTKMNLDFAEKYKLPLDRNYAIAPHHSGIYPINPLVYDIWSNIMNFNVTSTENYPYHYDLSTNHRGFIYRNLSVLPRQSCGLYTTTRYYQNISHNIEQSLMGGKLFRMILTNPIIIFMSHNVNYGYDRLGNYVFSKLIYLISKWTRIQFSEYLFTSELAQKYFYQYYPDEQMPIFTNPCNDQILMNLWHGNRSMCRIFPKFLIIGPQKTGTTALHSMLSQHPNIYPSKKNSNTYEELQFFSNDTIYLNGIDWYLNQFNQVSEQSINFEKSATYFDSFLVIKRIKALLPNIRLIMIFIEPGIRAYSRYQHEIIRTNQNLTFDNLLKYNHTNNSYLYHLKQRCLQPGHYAEYLFKWLKYFSSKQIYIIDGEKFRSDPREILNDIQISFLQLKHPINSSKLVKYNKKKGFFCSITNKKHFQCLGNSKGRQYDQMSSYSREYLNNYYLLHNENLLKLLRKFNYSLPLWLSDKN